MSLKLWLRRDISAITPSSNCFPCLKFLHVTVSYPDSDSMEKLFSCFPVLEDLIIDGELQDASAFNLDISAPKLKRLQIRFKVHKFAMRSGANNFVSYMCQLFINADAPNLEEIDICYDFLVSYSLKNAKCLSKATIDFLDVRVLKVLDCFLGLSDRIRQLFAGICNAKFLTVSAPIFVALGIGNHLLLPTLNNLNHSELRLQTCHCLQSLTTLLKISPKLEHLKISPNSKHLVFYNYKYCDDDNEDELGDWGTPEFVPIV